MPQRPKTKPKPKFPLSVTILQDKELPEKIEVIASAVIEVSEAMRKIRSGRLGDRAIILLIQDVSGVTREDIKKVLDACEILGDRYTKKKS
jgi:hypothetical protein